MSHLQTNPLIDSLPATVPFIGPETLERKRGRPFIARLGANESAFGPSPIAIEAMKAATAEAWCYGDPENYELTEALASFHSLDVDMITIGAGLDALLGLIVRQYITPGDIVINSLGGYPTFNYHVAGFGGQLVTVPYRNNHTDLPALAEAAHRPGVRIVYLANPDNPLGTFHDSTAIKGFVEAIPKHVLIILDEAYCETAPALEQMALLPLHDNVLRLRTFSKAYGLAGLRCGYTIGAPRIITAFDKIRDHFSVNYIAQAAALSALRDQIYLKATIEKITQARLRLYRIAEAHGLKALPSATNFVAIDCGRDGTFATHVLNELLERDIFVRKPTAPVLDRLIRVSTAPDHILDYFEHALGPALDAAAQKEG